MVNSRSASIAALSSSFLAGLERPAAHAILSAAQIQRISAKSNISTEGGRATRLFLVQSGRARFYHLTKQGELAQNNFGLCFQFGYGTVQNYEEAAVWFRRSAEGGLATAQFNLGGLYYEGNGLAKDLGTAIEWLAVDPYSS